MIVGPAKFNEFASLCASLERKLVVYVYYWNLVTIHLADFLWLSYANPDKIFSYLLFRLCIICYGFQFISFWPGPKFEIQFSHAFDMSLEIACEGLGRRMNWLNSAAYVGPQKRVRRGEGGHASDWLLPALEWKPFTIHFIICRTVLTCPILSCSALSCPVLSSPCLIDGQRSNTCRFEYFFKIIKRAIQQLVSFRFQFGNMSLLLARFIEPATEWQQIYRIFQPSIDTLLAKSKSCQPSQPDQVVRPAVAAAASLARPTSACAN